MWALLYILAPSLLISSVPTCSCLFLMALFCCTIETVNHEEIHHNYVINPIRIPAIDQLHHQGKVFIEFVYEVIHSYKNNSLLHQRTLISQYQDPEETKIELRRFDRSMLKSQRQMFRIMSSVLPMFRITKGTSLYNEIVDAIVETVSNVLERHRPCRFVLLGNIS